MNQLIINWVITHFITDILIFPIIAIIANAATPKRLPTVVGFTQGGRHSWIHMWRWVSRRVGGGARRPPRRRARTDPDCIADKTCPGGRGAAGWR